LRRIESGHRIDAPSHLADIWLTDALDRTSDEHSRIRWRRHVRGDHRDVFGGGRGRRYRDLVGQSRDDLRADDRWSLADIPHTIAIGIGLIRISDIGAIIDIVRYRIQIAVTGNWLNRASVARVASTITVRIGLIGVGNTGQLSEISG